MSTNGDMPTDTRQAPEAGALERKMLIAGLLRWLLIRKY